MTLRTASRRPTENMSRSPIEKKQSVTPSFTGQPGDVIVLAGKGHEDYQEIEGKKYHMDERELIQEILEEENLR